MNTDPLLCLICSTPTKPRQATAGVICGTDKDRLVVAIDEVRDWYMLIDTDDARFPGAIGAEQSGRRSPGFGSRSPANDTVLSLTDLRSRWDIDTGRTDGLIPPLEVIGGWAANLRDELGAQHTDRPQMSVDAAYLVRHVGHIVRQRWVVQMWLEVKATRDQLRAITGQPRPRCIGLCPNLVQDGESHQECRARLYAPTSGDTISCRSCGRDWPRREWAFLGGLLEAGTGGQAAAHGVLRQAPVHSSRSGTPVGHSSVNGEAVGA